MANLNLIKKYKGNSEIFFETGTWGGDGVQAAIDAGFKKIYSCDIDEDLIEKAKVRFLNNNVTLFRGDSGAVLKEIIDKIKGRALFFLDGHVMPKDSNDESLGFDDKQLFLMKSVDTTLCPLMEELKAISTSNIKNHIILIDDFHCFDTWIFGGVSFKEVVDFINTINTDYQCSIEQNVACFYTTQ